MISPGKTRRVIGRNALQRIAVAFAGTATGEKVEETPASVRNSAGVALHDLLAPGSDLLRYAARIFIPHQTTASAIRTQVAVRAFSKADEAIAVLSFAYPGETLSDSTGEPQLGKG
ncbi:hypothetical protein SAMN05444170_6664 [Bradyrhizobium erythrophlei]|uniref:Uncharacterized protein n=1 Tax=Bradyrhizobium erythrophlei TaxID=1437360 RepID=A0A1M7UTL3_9BRAD|nr:hypothetical protein SAMN05444170_6664 [Bradyrhizobium erythrophlei]